MSGSGVVRERCCQAGGDISSGTSAAWGVGRVPRFPLPTGTAFLHAAFWGRPSWNVVWEPCCLSWTFRVHLPAVPRDAKYRLRTMNTVHWMAIFGHKISGSDQTSLLELQKLSSQKIQCQTSKICQNTVLRVFKNVIIIMSIIG